MQLAVQRSLFLFVMGPFVWTLVRVLFSLRVVGRENFGAVERHGIIAVQHYYEWDPFVSYYASAYGWSFRRPQLVPVSLAGSFWVRTRVGRLVSWFLGLMGLSRGPAAAKAIERAAQLLDGEHPVVIAAYPTGPVGRQKDAEIRPGLAHLTLKCPEIPVLPVTFTGLQETYLRDVLLLRRPPVTVVIGRPFRGSEIEGETHEHRVEAIRVRLARAWAEGEAA